MTIPPITWNTMDLHTPAVLLLAILSPALAINTGCGGRLTATSETVNLTSPGFPQTYLKNVNCTWIIAAENENDTIYVEVKTAFPRQYPSKDSPTSCTDDAIRVYNGDTAEAGQLLGTFCSTQKPTYYSSKNSLLIELTTNESITSRGFMLHYSSRPDGNCNSTYTIYNTPVYIPSPGYPDSYSRNLDCVINLVDVMQPPNMRLDILTGDVEGDYPQCANGSLDLYGINGNHIGRFCGNSSTSPVGPYYSNGIYMKLVFSTGSDTSGTGVRLRVSHTRKKAIPFQSPFCGPRFLNATTHPEILKFPEHSTFAPNGVTCTWIITAPDHGMMVRITVLESDVQTSPDDYFACDYSRVTAYNGPSPSDDTILFWCGNSRPTLQSTGSAMTLQSITRYSNGRKGLTLKYFATNETSRCGGSVNLTTDKVTTLTGPYENSSSHDCHWTVRAPGNMNIRIKVRKLKQETDPTNTSTTSNYLELYDGTSTGSTTPGRWWGKSNAYYTSSGTIVTARFITGASDTTRGLQMDIKAGHFNTSQEMSLSADYHDKYFESTNYPFNYPSNIESTWTIQTNDYNQVKIAVIDSRLENSVGCSNDYVEAFDGSDSSAASLGRWCGESQPNKTSSGSFMFLIFRTNSHTSGSGFRILYTAHYKDVDTDTSFPKVALIIVGSIAGVALLFGLPTAICKCASKRAGINEGKNNRSSVSVKAPGGTLDTPSTPDNDKLLNKI
ncbi:cubilin-like [Haliotis asinina]|uniref:cubilin-like n=1 Tax=Haliotis asinina TaxID=109174 RepID=UPI0035318D1A